MKDNADDDKKDAYNTNTHSISPVKEQSSGNMRSFLLVGCIGNLLTEINGYSLASAQGENRLFLHACFSLVCKDPKEHPRYTSGRFPALVWKNDKSLTFVINKGYNRCFYSLIPVVYSLTPCAPAGRQRGFFVCLFSGLYPHTTPRFRPMTLHTFLHRRACRTGVDLNTIALSPRQRT